MESISAFTSAHPALWLVILAVVGLVVLRALARLACLATLVIGFVILAGFGTAVMKGLA
jgi:hypothetical protein